jgi:DNA-binding helix-hairpin-helix protein with protein kinase domain
MRMKITYKLSNDSTIQVENTAFASGGEADVYEILSPSSYRQQVLKLYKPDKASKSKEDKLKFLIANKPSTTEVDGHNSVIWPIHLAFYEGKFVGYTMPKATGVKLELLCHPKLPRGISSDFDKFSFTAPNAIDLRLKLCFNIAVALSQIHSFGSYVLVDLKPDNVMIKPDGLISLIDIDSTEVISSSILLFPAHVATPEYTPPEYYNSHIQY